MKTIAKNKHKIVLQKKSRSKNIPSRSAFQRWINSALAQFKMDSEVTIRIVDTSESAKLNKNYRNKTGATNILSFPFEAPPDIQLPLLGDLVICAPLISKEAKEQNKPLLAHWAHITIHGTLHLLGYDHIKNKDAKIMESLEIKLLRQLGYKNPYE